MNTVLRAVIGYFFLLFVVRVIGRRPGAQMTPFEFVLIFFIGGLTIQAVVGDDHSLVNAISAIATVAMLHVLVAWAKQNFPAVADVTDGTPLMLLERGEWHSETMYRLRIQESDVMQAAREQGLKALDEIRYAILERNGGISIIPEEKG